MALRLLFVAFLAMVGCTLATARPDPPREDECVRALPVPVLDVASPRVRDHRFEFDRPRLARETAIIDADFPVTILHSGCAHYNLVFVFSIPRGETGLGDLHGLVAMAEESMTRLSGIAPYTDKISRALSSVDPAHYVLGEPIELIADYEFISVTLEESASDSLSLQIHYEILL